MKKLFYILIIVCPALVCGQQPCNTFSPFDYMWQNVGNPGFSTGQVSYLNFALSPSGVPYVVFSNYKANVMKFDGTSWVYVGDAGFSAVEARYTTIDFSPSGQPYVAFMDWANSQKSTVMKFNGEE